MKKFDIVLENPIDLHSEKPKTIGQILFEDRPGRNENDLIILSHIDTKYTEISLRRLRFIVSNLLADFKRQGITHGDTVVLLNFSGCNEMYTALLFLALATNGCRVFLPMFSETTEFENWLEMANVKHIIVPEGEVMSLEGHDKDKDSVKRIRKIAEKRKIPLLDIISVFGLAENILFNTISGQPETDEVLTSLKKAVPGG